MSGKWKTININIFDIMAILYGIVWIYTKYKEPSMDNEAYPIFLAQLNHYATLTWITITASVLLNELKDKK